MSGIINSAGSRSGVIGELVGNQSGTGAFEARGVGGWVTYGDGNVIAFTDDSTGDSFDTDGVYNTSDSKYTASGTGVYYFWASIYVPNDGTYSTTICFSTNNGEVNMQDSYSNFFIYHTAADEDEISAISVVIPLTSGDTFWISAGAANTKIYRGHSQFGGCRLR